MAATEPYNDVLDAASTKEEYSGESDDNAKPDDDFLHGLPLFMMIIALMFGIFIMAIDYNVLATAIPRITSEFNSLPDVGWYGSAYMLTQMSLQPLFGRIYTYFGSKWTYLSAILIFEIGSIIIATAPSSAVLIIGRAVAGVGAAGLFNGTFVIIGHIVELRKRPKYISYVGSVNGIASALGPVFAFGFLTIILTLFFYRRPLRGTPDLTLRQKILKLDFVGCTTLVGSMVCLLLALQLGGVALPWSSAPVVGLLVGFFLLILTFAAFQYIRPSHALISPKLISQRTVLSASFFTLLSALSFQAQCYYLPFFFQSVRDMTASASGILLLPLLVTQIVTTLVSGALMTFIGQYVPFVWIGSSVQVIGSGLLYTLGRGTSTAAIVGFQIVVAFGSGMAVQIPFVAVQAALQVHNRIQELPAGAAVAGFFNALGLALGSGLAQGVFLNSLIGQLRLITGIDPQKVIAAGAVDLEQSVPEAYIGSIRLAYSEALQSVWVLALVSVSMAFVAGFALERLSLKDKLKDSDGECQVAKG